MKKLKIKFVYNKAKIFKIYNILKNFFKKLEEEHVKEYAIQCAYYIIMSLIPFLILLFSFIQLTNIREETIYFLTRNIFPRGYCTFCR